MNDTIMLEVTNEFSNVFNDNSAVFFMTAYEIHEIETRKRIFPKKIDIQRIMKNNHIDCIITENHIVTLSESIPYMLQYDDVSQMSRFSLNCEDMNVKKEDYFISVLQNVKPFINLRHSVTRMLDVALYHISVIFEMKSFFVYFNSKEYFVKPFAFVINGMIIVCYQLLEEETNKSIPRSKILGRENNYNIQIADKIKYLGDITYKEDERKVSDIIFYDIVKFLEESSDLKMKPGNYSFVHNILVATNEVEDVCEYFKQIININIDDFSVKNLSTASEFRYYSKEYMGLLVMPFKEDFEDSIYDCILLETMKMYFLLKMVVDYEVLDDLEKILNNQMKLELLFYPMHAPVITLNAIENVKETISFQRFKAAIEYKINVLKACRQKNQDKNSKLMNILLYVLSVFGSIEVIGTLADKLSLPFVPGLIFVIIVFGLAGLFWMKKDKT